MSSKLQSEGVGTDRDEAASAWLAEGAGVPLSASDTDWLEK